MIGDIPIASSTSLPLSLFFSFLMQLSSIGGSEPNKPETQKGSEVSLIQEYREAVDLISYGPAIPVTPLPKEPEPPQPKQLLRVWATAYCSHPAYTDSSPFITASGQHVAPEIIAANFLRFNTEVAFPELRGFEKKKFIVGDRMNPRFWHAVDLWFPTCNEARQFGRKATTVAIY